MKVYCERLKPKTDERGLFLRAKIEIEKVEEWSTIASALKNYKEWIEERGWDVDEDKQIVEMYERVKNAIDDLDVEKEIVFYKSSVF